jgi:protein-tyrosine-phosphatase
MPDPRRVLFVCTGNLCRSPMAEAIASRRWASTDFVFESAGVLAVTGAPATTMAAAACEESGVDLTAHRARQFDGDLAAAADLILVMTEAHRRRVLELAPEAAAKVDMLRPDGEDVDDPYGQPLEVYRASRDEIVAALESRFGRLPSGQVDRPSGD